ncbi:hypothetical protein ACHQM5_030389 [Ranunculus cassubicifolius]
MFKYTHFSRTLCTFSSPISPSPQNLPKTLLLQNLLKSGFTPTLQSLNQFLSFLSNTRRFNYLLQFFSQMKKNNIHGDSETKSIVAATLVKFEKYEEAERFMIKDRVFIHRGVWDSLIQRLCGETPEKAFILLQDCLNLYGVSLSSKTFCLLIHCFSDLGKMGRAIEVLELMTGEKIGYCFDNFVCSSIISGFCKIGKPELALGFYDNVEKSGALSCPNVVTYTALVNALCKQGRVKEVQDLVCKMENEGVVLDAVFYSSWICGYFDKGVLKEAFRKHWKMLGKGIMPDTVSYTILIDGFSKEGNLEKAVGFLNEMKKGGLRPNLVTYTAIIRGFCKRGKLEEAFSVFKKIKDIGITVDEVTYSTLIDGLCRVGDFDRVFLLLEEMEKKGMSLGIITYNTVINGLCKFGRTTEADDISNSMFVDNFTFSTLLHGYFLENDVAGVLETKRRIEEAGIQMDVVMCNVLIKALFMVGAPEDACMIFQGMPDMGLVADSVTYYTMIDGYCRKGMVDKALEIFDASRGTTSITNLGCYGKIIHALCENGMVDVAADVFTELIGKDTIPTKATYMVLLKALFYEKNEVGVLKFVHRFEELEHLFHFIGNGAIHFFCKMGCIEAAFDLYMVLRVNRLGVTRNCYYLILEGLIASGNTLLVSVVLNPYIKEYGLSGSRINKILVTYLCDEDVNKVIPLLNKMEQKNTFVTVPVVAVEALVKQNRALDAYELVLKARGCDSHSDVVSYSIVVDRLCKEGYPLKALDLCATMRDRGISTNIVTYNSVISGLCQQGCLVEALRLFDSLERISLAPTDYTYGTLITALSKEGYLEDAKKLFDKMVLGGLTPPTRIYNSLIDGYCKFSLLKEALKLLTSPNKICFVADSFTVSAIINGFCRKGDMEGALTFYYEYKRNETLPDFFGFLYLIKGLCVKGRMEEARGILREMLDIQSIVEVINRAGYPTETISLANVVVSLCEQGNIEQATVILGEIGSREFSSRKKYSGATNVKNPSEKKVQSVFISKSSPLEGDCLSAKFSEMSNASSELVDPDNSFRQRFCDFDSYYPLLASLCSNGKLDKANQVAKEMLVNLHK